MKRRFLLSLMLFSSTFLMTACFDGGSDNPETVALNFTESIYSGDIDEVLSAVHIPKQDLEDAEAKEIIHGKLKEAVARTKKKADSRGGFKESAIVSKQIDESKGIAKIAVNTVFKDEGSSSAKDNLRLTLTEDGWKIKL